jgi:flagellin-like hook-associated protein FlgL
LNNEANALVGEFNRIIESSEFNGVPLFNESPLELRLQLGHGNDGSIGFDIGAELARTVGDGTFGTRVSYATAAGVRFVALGDVNNDNILDMVSSDSAALTATIFLGLGNGSFASTTSVTVGNAYALTM